MRIILKRFKKKIKTSNCFGRRTISRVKSSKSDINNFTNISVVTPPFRQTCRHSVCSLRPAAPAAPAAQSSVLRLLGVSAAVTRRVSSPILSDQTDRRRCWFPGRSASVRWHLSGAWPPQEEALSPTVADEPWHREVNGRSSAAGATVMLYVWTVACISSGLQKGWETKCSYLQSVALFASLYLLLVRWLCRLPVQHLAETAEKPKRMAADDAAYT